MRIEFAGKTNKNYVMINTLKIKLKSGSVITIDRDTTEWSYNEKTGDLDMTWNDCYLWAIDDFNIFSHDEGPGYPIQSQYAVEEFIKLIMDGQIELELEEDADDDYWVKIDHMDIVR